MPGIELSSVCKSFGATEALRGVSFRVAPGEIYGLLGPNGAGKTTAINILCGLIRPDSGTARLSEQDVSAGSVDARRSLGVVPQEPALYMEMSARQNLTFFGRLYGLRGTALREAIDRALARVDLAGRADEPIERFSGGMVRRLNIAAGVVHAPRVVLMDEPTVGLDPQTRLSILDLVRGIARGGAAVLYTTHYLDEAERLCDRVGIIDHGTLLAEGTLDQLRQAAGAQDIVVFRGAFKAERGVPALAGVGDADLVSRSEGELLFAVHGAEGRITPLLAVAQTLGEVREVAIKQPSLENLFIKLTGRELRE
jgi:ABC-2 type transport system ATP-binding protein